MSPAKSEPLAARMSNELADRITFFRMLTYVETGYGPPLCRRSWGALLLAKKLKSLRDPMISVRRFSAVLSHVAVAVA
jgi:hypothetical protein